MALWSGVLALNNGTSGSISSYWVAPPPRNIQVIMVFEYLYIFVAKKFLDKKDKENVRSYKHFLSEFDKKRLKSLNRLLKDNNIYNNDIEKIQIIINEIDYEKKNLLPLTEFKSFVVKPFVVFLIPCIVVLFDHFTQNQAIELQMLFLASIFLVFSILSAVCFLFIDPIRWILYHKYDELINDLKLLSIVEIS